MPDTEDDERQEKEHPEHEMAQEHHLVKIILVNVAGGFLEDFDGHEVGRIGPKQCYKGKDYIKKNAQARPNRANVLLSRGSRHFRLGHTSSGSSRSLPDQHRCARGEGRNSLKIGVNGWIYGVKWREPARQSYKFPRM